MLPIVAATLSPARRILTPIIGAAFATFVIWAMRRSAADLRFEEYVQAVRLKNGRIPFRSTVWRTASSAFSIATGAAIGREGSMIQFAAAISSWVGERSPLGKSRCGSPAPQSRGVNTGHLRHGTAGGCCDPRPVHGGSDGGRTYRAMASPGHILPCSLLASFIARTISRESLYAIATPEPAQ
jgi:Voltage gated chloride channel